MKKEIEVVAAIIMQDGTIFATQRGYGAFKGGWELPGGKIETGETHAQALIREIHEELDTTIAVDDFLTTVDYDYPDFHLTMHCYFCHVVAGCLTLKEHLAAKWLDAASLDTVSWLPADLALLPKIKARLQADEKSGYSRRNAERNSAAECHRI